MKTFKFLGMVLLAIVLCANLSSCSDDGEKFITDKYYFNGNKSKIIMFYDDFIEGIIEWKDNKVVYHYRWGDTEGDWIDQERYTMILTRIK